MDAAETNGPVPDTSPKTVDGSKTKPGENPFWGTNGRKLLTEKIQELAAGISEARDAAVKVPEIPFIVVNNFVNLKNGVGKLLDIVYMVPFEDVIVRYKLCVRSYDLQAKNLLNILDSMRTE